MTQFKSSDLGDLVPNFYNEKIAEQFNGASPLLRELAKAGRVMGQISNGVQWALEGQPTATATFAEGAAFSTPGQAPSYAASLPWGRYHNTLELTDEAMSVARAQGVPVEDLLSTKLSGNMRSLAKKVNADLYNGAAGGNSIVGLTLAVSESDYAGVPRATTAQICNGVVSDVSDVLSWDVMNELDLELTQFDDGSSYNMIFCNPIEYSAYAKICRDGYSSWASMGKGDAGVSVLEFNGRPLIKDASCPSGKMFFLNLDTISVRYLIESSGTQIVTSPGSGLQLSLKQAAVVGHAKVWNLSSTLQMLVHNPNRNGVLTNIG